MPRRERTSDSPQDSGRLREQVGGGTTLQPPAVEVEMVAFKIDGYDKVYRIKKTILSEPGVFSGMLSTFGLGGDGMPDEQTIRLNDVTPEDFETLVHFYNDFEMQGIPADTAPFRYWDRLKRVSRCYCVTDAEERAHKELFDILIEQNPIMAIVIAEQNPGADQEWLYAAYRKLCLRARPLSDDEAGRLHGATVNRITRAREKIRHWNSLSVARRRAVSRDSIIREVFRIHGGAHKGHSSR